MTSVQSGSSYGGLRNRRGFLLMEVMIGIGVFAVFLSAVGLTMLYGQEGTITGGDRMHATQLSQKAIEAARAIRDDDISSLTPGTHGIALDASGTWTLSGAQTVATGGYVTTLTIADVADGHLLLTAQTDWKRGYNREGSVSVTAEITDWRGGVDTGDWSSVSIQGSYVDAGTPLFNALAVSGDYAFATGETSDGGNGFYIFDISSLTAPVRIASSFHLGAPGYGIGVKGQRLYVLTGDEAAEVQVYDIADPATFSVADLVTSYDLPGAARGRAVAVGGDTLYVGASYGATSGEAELYAFDISSGTSPILLDELDVEGGITDIALSGTAAWLATTENVTELRTVNIENPSSMVAAQSYNLTDVQDGQAIAVSGTAALLGRADGAAIEEIVLFRASPAGLPAHPPGPWQREAGAAVNAVAAEPSGCYGFIASAFANKELQIVSIAGTSLPERTFLNVTSGEGRGLTYDATRDRLFLLTNSAVHIVQPASPTGICS